MTEKQIQLHKKGDSTEPWYPITRCTEVQLTGYTREGMGTGSISPSDDLKMALAKLENKVGTVYKVQGTQSSSFILNNASTLLRVENVGNVYNITDEFTTTSNFVEGSGHRIAAGSNVVIMKPSAESQIFYDVLSMSVTSGGSGVVGSGNTGQLAIYSADNSTTVTGSNGLVYTSSKLQVTGAVRATSNQTFNQVSCSIYSDGNIYSGGNITSTYSSSSDKRLKKDIEDFNGVDVLDKLNFKKFKWNDKVSEVSSELKENTTSYGVIAQDSDGIIDEFVFDMNNGYKGVRYEKLIPIMAQAIKDLKEEIERLKSK